MAPAVPITGSQAGGRGRLLCWLLLNHHLFWEIGGGGGGSCLGDLFGLKRQEVLVFTTMATTNGFFFNQFCGTGGKRW